MSIHEDWREEKRPGMSPAAKVLLILGGVGAVCMLLCCGAFMFGIWKFQAFMESAVSDDPAKILDRTRQMVDLTMPPGFEPKQSMDLYFVKMVTYEDAGEPAATIALAEFGGGIPVDREQQQRELTKALREQGHDPEALEPPADGAIERETRDMLIGGDRVPVQISTYKTADGTVTTRHVTASFRGKSGVVVLTMMVPGERFDEAATMKLLESMSIVPAPETDEEEAGDDAGEDQLPAEKPDPEASQQSPEAPGGTGQPGTGPQEESP